MRIGLLWRAEWDPPGASGPHVETCKLRGVFAAFSALGVEAQPVVYTDSCAEAVRQRLLRFDGVLVWVNPIQNGLDRSTLDPLLHEVAAEGVWVSAHPDVILRMGTKEVLVDTASMSWSADTRIYRTAAEFREQLPKRLVEAGVPLVLKRNRGMGGDGVWKIALDTPATVVAQHAAGTAPERMTLKSFLSLCDAYFAGTGLIVEQPYQLRLPEGMIRAYLTHEEVVGFTHQYPRGLMPPGDDTRPAGKTFEPPTEPSYSALRMRLEQAWVPEMQRLLGIETHDLPVIWDADFLYGPKDSTGADTFVLCEINVSSTFAFPDFAMPGVARAAIDKLRKRGA